MMVIPKTQQHNLDINVWFLFSMDIPTSFRFNIAVSKSVETGNDIVKINSLPATNARMIFNLDCPQTREVCLE